MENIYFKNRRLSKGVREELSAKCSRIRSLDETTRSLAIGLLKEDVREAAGYITQGTLRLSSPIRLFDNVVIDAFYWEEGSCVQIITSDANEDDIPSVYDLSIIELMECVRCILETGRTVYPYIVEL